MPRARRSSEESTPSGSSGRSVAAAANQQPRNETSTAASEAMEAADVANQEIAADLRYGEARAALELVLAQLQSSDLDVEAMAKLYRRGQTYLQRCEAVLQQVEQQVLLWDGLEEPDQPPRPLTTAPVLPTSEP
jgi:exodeoxyribonuclease VII small subunit